MNAEVDATIGPILQIYAKKHGVILSACDGDEPGLQMNLVRWVKGLGLIPRVIGNVKGLQDPYRNPTTQQGWAERWGQNAAMVTSFADGSKISFEQSIVANATGFKVLERGMSRGRVYDGNIMDIAEALRHRRGPRDRRRSRLHGRSAGVKVFVLAEHADPKQRHYLNLYKMGEGPLYPFWIPYHLVHFEAPNSIARVVLFGDELAPPLGGPVVEVCAVAKRDLKAGEVLDEYGMYMTYGEACNVEEMSSGRYLPEGLVEGCRLKRDIPKDQVSRTTTSSCPPVALPTRCGRSSTGTSAATPGSRTTCATRANRFRCPERQPPEPTGTKQRQDTLLYQHVRDDLQVIPEGAGRSTPLGFLLIFLLVFSAGSWARRGRRRAQGAPGRAPAIRRRRRRGRGGSGRSDRGGLVLLQGRDPRLVDRPGWGCRSSLRRVRRHGALRQGFAVGGINRVRLFWRDLMLPVG